MSVATDDQQADLAAPVDERTIALSVRQLAVIGAAVIVLLAILVQGRRWRAR